MGGAFASINASQILADCPFIDHVGRGRGRGPARRLPRQPPRRPGQRGRPGLAGRRRGREERPAPAAPGPRPVTRTRTAPRCPSTTSSRCRSTSRRCSRSTSSAPSRPRGAAPTPASTATSPRSPRASGAAARPSTCWARCRSSPTRATAPSTSPTTTSCSSASASPTSATASSTASSSSTGGARGASTRWASRRSRSWGRPTATCWPTASSRAPRRCSTGWARSRSSSRSSSRWARPRSTASPGCTASSSSAGRARPPRTSARPSASRPGSQLDTFGFNRLAVYRGTPLWNEYASRGIVDDDRDWDKTFKCCDIDPDTVPNDEVNALRMKGYVSLLLTRIVQRPVKTWGLFRTFSRHMPARDLFRLISGPFRKKVGAGARPAGADGGRRDQGPDPAGELIPRGRLSDQVLGPVHAEHVPGEPGGVGPGHAPRSPPPRRPAW